MFHRLFPCRGYICSDRATPLQIYLHFRIHFPGTYARCVLYGLHVWELQVFFKRPRVEEILIHGDLYLDTVSLWEIFPATLIITSLLTLLSPTFMKLYPFKTETLAIIGG